MPMPRTPKSKAVLTGRDRKDPQRFRDRIEPNSPPIGPPPSWMSGAQGAVWEQFVAELPWLTGSHRALLEIAVTVRCRVMAGEDVGVQALNLLRQCLGQMGAAPADASKVSAPAEDVPNPFDEILQ